MDDLVVGGRCVGRPQDVVPGALESRGFESSGGSEGGAWE